MQHDKIIRILHWGFALLLPLQLLSEEFMKRPKPGRVRDDIQTFFFDMHEWIGMTALMFVVLRLCWGFASKEPSFKRLYPYMTKQGCQGLTQELKQELPLWLKGKLTEPGKIHFISGTVHGLGLLLVLLMGITGAVMLYGMEPTGKMLGLVHDAKEVHEMLGGLIWAYFIAHVGMTVWHMLAGHPMLQRMFSLK